MPSTITHLELKTFLETTLFNHLGTYTFPGGTLPAIALLPHPELGYYFPPDTWSVTGIEAVVIRPVSAPGNSRQRISGDLSQNYYWRIVLKQHDQTGDLYEAMDILMPALSQNYAIVSDMGGYTPPSQGNLIIASATVVILDPTLAANI